MNQVILASSPRRVLTAIDARRLRAMLETRAAGRSPMGAALEREIARAEIVAALTVPPDVITMNSRVLCVAPRGSRELQLVYPWDASSELGRISVLSELGLALLGNRIGARVRASSRLGARGFDVPATWGLSQLLYQPEEAGDLYL